MGTPSRLDSTLSAGEVDALISAFGSVSNSLRKLCGLVEVVAWVGVLGGLWCVLLHPTVACAIENMVVIFWKLAVILAIGAGTSVVWNEERKLSAEIAEAEEAAQAAEAAAKTGKASAEHGTCGSALSQLTRARVARLKSRSVAGSATASTITSATLQEREQGVAIAPLNLNGVRQSTADAEILSPTGETASIATPTPREQPELLSWWLNKIETAMWKPVSFTDKTGDAKVWSDPTESLPFLKVKTTMPIPMDYFFDFMHDLGPETQKMKVEMDENILEMTEVWKGPKKGHCVAYTRFSFPWPMSQRDMVSENVYYPVSSQKNYMSVADVEHPSKPEVKGVIRAMTKAFYVVNAVDDGKKCCVEFFTQFDPRGSIPHALLAMFKAKTAGFFIAMRQQLHKRYEESKES
eukprot:TRINITY_DN5103_c0_g2_i1.p1 TRINITY_DN5103_c0_g2~~TRINITY_DN5103_c0_g2_i1.p1  ORF type:complete len:408 (+),score=104.33 TRINITY_DN5103_c0_g2_i1:56-1279(+)